MKRVFQYYIYNGMEGVAYWWHHQITQFSTLVLGSGRPIKLSQKPIPSPSNNHLLIDNRLFFSNTSNSTSVVITFW